MLRMVIPLLVPSAMRFVECSARVAIKRAAKLHSRCFKVQIPITKWQELKATMHDLRHPSALEVRGVYVEKSGNHKA
jgi:hypothetical protein